MTYLEISVFIGLTISLEYKFIIKQWKKVIINIGESKEEKYQEINTEVQNNLTGIITACSESFIIFLILDDESDIEIPIKLKNIISINMVKNEIES